MSRGDMKKFTVHVSLADGKTVKVTLDPEIVRSARLLPEAPDRYFLTAGSLLFPLSELLLTRARPEGIANAVHLMKAAYAGEHSRRPPVEVRKVGEQLYLVEDGNSTTAVAMAAGWSLIPCILR